MCSIKNLIDSRILFLFIVSVGFFANGILASCPSDPASGFQYPWPVKCFSFETQAQNLSMAYMDVHPKANCNGRSVVLLHGKNFCGATWNATAKALLREGYRVIMPDQVGFCKSTKPMRLQYSFQQLAANTNALLSHLGLGNKAVTVLGHSMGGMLAARYALMYPNQTERLIMTNPLGLEDWKALGVPYRSIDAIWKDEQAQNFTTLKAYEQATYYAGTWNSSYDVWINMLVNIYYGPERKEYTYDQALVTDMVLDQPVIYEFPIIKPKTLLLIGDKDNTAIGKQWSPPEVQAILGHYNVLGKQAAAKIPNSTLIEFAGLGHAPQIQDPDAYQKALLGWLSAP
jgi:pimeloyl-ACP methyl ester carboxylesterase